MTDLFRGIYRNKTVLVTGHSGFKGSWLSFWLSRMGAKVIGYSLEAPTDPNHLSLLDCNIVSLKGDILDRELLKKTFEQYKPEIVFHLAAQALVRHSYQYPVETFTTNVIGTLNVLEAAKQSGSVKAFVAITSDKVYENKEWSWGYRESDAIGGYDPYSASKGCTEVAVSSFRRSFCNVAAYGKDHSMLISTVRAGNVIGGGDWAADRLIPDVVRSGSKNEEVVIRSPGAIRPWQHVLECLSGYLLVGHKLLECDGVCADGWNFGPPDEGALTVEAVVKKVVKYWPQVTYRIESGAHNPHEANYLKLDCSKSRQQLSWKPVWNVEKTFEKTIGWYRAFYDTSKVNTGSDLKSFVDDARREELVWTK